MNERFVTETIEREDGTSFQREVLLTDAGNGEMAARVATDADRAKFSAAYAVFKRPEAELRRQMDELMARHEDLKAQHDEIVRGVDGVSGSTVDDAPLDPNEKRCLELWAISPRSPAEQGELGGLVAAGLQTPPAGPAEVIEPYHEPIPTSAGYGDV